MIGIYNTIQLNGVELFRPNDFAPKREDIYGAEITTCSGKVIADRVGWRYADMTLNWDTLPQAQKAASTQKAQDYYSASRGGVTTDADGVSHTEQVIPTSRVWVATRFTGLDGNPCWKDVSMGVRFVNAHH